MGVCSSAEPTPVAVNANEMLPTQQQSQQLQLPQSNPLANPNSNKESREQRRLDRLARRERRRESARGVRTPISQKLAITTSRRTSNNSKAALHLEQQDANPRAVVESDQSSPADLKDSSFRSLNTHLSNATIPMNEYAAICQWNEGRRQHNNSPGLSRVSPQRDTTTPPPPQMKKKTESRPPPLYQRPLLPVQLPRYCQSSLSASDDMLNATQEGVPQDAMASTHEYVAVDEDASPVTVDRQQNHGSSLSDFSVS